MLWMREMRESESQERSPALRPESRSAEDSLPLEPGSIHSSLLRVGTDAHSFGLRWITCAEVQGTVLAKQTVIVLPDEKS